MSTPLPTISQLVKIGHQKLQENGLAASEADILLAHILTVEKEYLYIHGNEPVPLKQWQLFSALLEKRLHGVSIAVLVGYKYFYGLRFKVTEDTLVPRPESELIVDQAVEFLKHKKNASVLDMGTGSGNLIISIAAELQKDKISECRFYAADISPQALAIARENAHLLGVSIHFFFSNLFSSIRHQRFDLIVANLPYLTTEQLTEPSIRREPIGALWGGTQGLDLYEALLAECEAHLLPKARVLLEIDPSQSTAIKQKIADMIFGVTVSSFVDLAGLERVICLNCK